MGLIVCFEGSACEFYPFHSMPMSTSNLQRLRWLNTMRNQFILLIFLRHVQDLLETLLLNKAI